MREGELVVTGGTVVRSLVSSCALCVTNDRKQGMRLVGSSADVLGGAVSFLDCESSDSGIVSGRRRRLAGAWLSLTFVARLCAAVRDNAQLTVAYEASLRISNTSNHAEW